MTTAIGTRIHTPHTFAFLYEAQFSPWKRRLFRFVEARLARDTARMIAVSPSEGRTMEQSGVVPAGRVRVVPNGIDPLRVQQVPALDLTRFGLDPARPTAAVIGLLYEGKGQDLALEALGEAGCESLQLLIVGPGPQDRLAAAARERGLADRVRFTGARDDVPSILAALDLLLLPSRWEGMPYIVLEAMAAGLPVVATPVDGARDLVVDGETGALAEGIEAPALGRALARVLAAARPTCGPKPWVRGVGYCESVAGALDRWHRSPHLRRRAGAGSGASYSRRRARAALRCRGRRRPSPPARARVPRAAVPESHDSTVRRARLPSRGRHPRWARPRA